MRNGKNEASLVADLLAGLSEEVNRLRTENNRLRGSIAPPADDYPSLMRFLDDVVEVVARHPDAQAAPAYFVTMLKQAREQVE